MSDSTTLYETIEANCNETDQIRAIIPIEADGRGEFGVLVIRVQESDRYGTILHERYASVNVESEAFEWGGGVIRPWTPEMPGTLADVYRAIEDGEGNGDGPPVIMPGFEGLSDAGARRLFSPPEDAGKDVDEQIEDAEGGEEADMGSLRPDTEASRADTGDRTGREIHEDDADQDDGEAHPLDGETAVCDNCGREVPTEDAQAFELGGMVVVSCGQCEDGEDDASD